MSWFSALRRARPVRRRESTPLVVERLEGRELLDANTTFLNKAFTDLLNRAPDPAGLAAFRQALAVGLPRSDAVSAIERSPEFLKAYVTKQYQTYLNHAPNAAGLVSWVAYLGAGGQPTQLQAALVGSQEYFVTRGGSTNNGFLDALYSDVLNRAVDAPGRASFNAAFNSGLSAKAAFNIVNSSRESRTIIVNGLYNQFLGHAADPDGLTIWTAALFQGLNTFQVTASIMAGESYAAYAPSTPGDPPPQLTAQEVKTLLDRASAATPDQGAIIAIVDRGGNLLGVRRENGVDPKFSAANPALLSFAIDGAISLARTGAFFANNQAPLTSRTIHTLSQSTITQRMVDSFPEDPNKNSPYFGPGIVAPIQVGGYFPPGVPYTPQVDLLGIEFTNRDSSNQAGLTFPTTRFNVNPDYIPYTIPPSQQLNAPDSYGVISGIYPSAQARGIGTLPGGLPIYKTLAPDQSDLNLVGGIGVFYPGQTGFASAENSTLSSGHDPNKIDLSMEAEYVAFAAIGGAPFINYPVNNVGGIPRLPEIVLPITPSAQRIDLAGITLDIVGPGGVAGPGILSQFGQALGPGIVNGTNLKVNPAGDTALPGQAVPDGWLVIPHNGVGITAAQVALTVQQGINQASITRAAIRFPMGTPSSMVFAVSDLQGSIVGLYRMPDATVFSIGVAVAKARNMAYYNNVNQLQAVDQLPGVPKGVAFTARTFRYLTLTHFPEGIPTMPPAIWSSLNDPTVDRNTALNIGPQLPASAYPSMESFIAFNPTANFHSPFFKGNQSGTVLFPGSASLYVGPWANSMIGGYGVSGDGVNQDDVVTSAGIVGFTPSNALRIDALMFGGVRLPYLKYDRNPEGP